MRKFFWALGLPLRAIASLALLILGFVVCLINYDAGLEMWGDARKVIMLGLKKPETGRRPL